MKWFSEDIDVRTNPEIADQVIAFLNEHKTKSMIVMEEIFGCPHEGGSDYPVGQSCPKCDRFTLDRIH